MQDVIVVFDIGKTNKKMFLFDRLFKVVHSHTTQFKEVLDDDGYPCDDIEAIEQWILQEVNTIQAQKKFNIKAINFSTHGATLVYLDKAGERITPLYNYLKPLDVDFNAFYQRYEGVEEFSRKTASPAYGMLNAGLQIYWLKQCKPHFWEQVHAILHYPQYLSYLFTNEITADFTSIGAHTALWNFDKMVYHEWLQKEKICLPLPESASLASSVKINGQAIAVGKGVHDSSASMVPILEKQSTSTRAFVLLSTGTWIISMNPFSKETLTVQQLNNDCLCFMTPDRRQIKSSMQFLGHVHEMNAIALGEYFKVAPDAYKALSLDRHLCKTVFNQAQHAFFQAQIPADYKGNFKHLNNSTSYETAYYQLVFEIAHQVCQAIQLILDANSNLEAIYMAGGFNKNEIFIEFLSLMMPEIRLELMEGEQGSALGAAMLMKDYI